MRRSAHAPSVLAISELTVITRSMYLVSCAGARGPCDSHIYLGKYFTLTVRHSSVFVPHLRCKGLSFGFCLDLGEGVVSC